MAIPGMNPVNPGIGPVVEFLTLPSKNFLVSRADISHSRRIWRYNERDFPDVLNQLAKHFRTLL
jgi:hypothetical protein